MKKIVLSLFFLVTLFFMHSTYAVQFSNINREITSCTGADVDQIFYIDDQKLTKFVGDTYTPRPTRRAISNNLSTVRLWQSDSNLVAGCTSSDSWRLSSNYAPANTEVLAFGSNCTFNRPTDPNNRNVQFVYNVGNYAIGNTGDINLGNFLFSYVGPERNSKVTTVNINNAHLSGFRKHANECANVELQYCGDGIVNPDFGETCDPLAPGFDETTCSTVSCTPIEIPTPKITVDKTDANQDDLDANVDDSQTVNTGDTSVFGITVTNSGEEDLKDVILTDPRAPACNRTVAQTNDLIKAIGNGDTIFNIGESFTYTCERPNSTTNFVNTISVQGTGVNSGTVVDDSDPTNVFVLPVPMNFDLALRKILSGQTPGPFSAGDIVRFNIQVINQGDVVATDTQVTDYIPEGLTFVPGNGWTVGPNNTVTQVVPTIAVGSSITLPIEFTIDTGVTGPITNLAEISGDSGDDCDSTPDNNPNNDGTPDDNAVGTGCNPGGDEDDHDPETIIVGAPVFDLALIKTLSDTTPGPFNIGDDVTFNITVTNQGDIDAENVEVTDFIPVGLTLNDTSWTLSGDKATQVIPAIASGASVMIPITFTIDADATGTIVNFAEISEDNNDDCDSVADTINGNQPGETDGMEINDDIGDGCNPGGDEDDNDAEPIEVIVFDLALRKTVSDTTPAPFTPGDTVTFNIEVINQGNVNSGIVEITDYIPTGLTLNDTAWTLTGNTATRTITNIAPGATTVVSITFTIDASATGVINNFAEISSDSGDDCDSTPDSTNENGTGESTELINDDTGMGCEPGGDEDDHDIEPITVLEPAYDLALRKIVSVVTPGPFNTGDSVTFTITVFNQGTIDSGEVEITDYIPTGLTLNDTAWTQSGTMAVRTIGSIASGNSTTLNITFTINDDAPQNINNFAEISSDNGEDCDSIPDSINGNEDGENIGLIDDAIGTACEPGGDEDDHDIAPIVVQDGEITPPTCDSITANPNSARGDTLTTTLTCTGTQVDTFRIEVRDEAGNIVNTINEASGQVTLSRGSASTANFTARCFINNTITSNTCEQTLQITSGGGGGGNPAVCLDIVQTSANTYQCIGNDNANSISMRCGSDEETGNTIYLPTQTGVLGTDNRRTANFSCEDSVPKCIVRKLPGAPTPINENNWIDSAACEFTTPVCGDGIVNPATESCDAGSNNGQPGFACTNQCTIPGSSSGGGSGGGGSSGGGSGGSSSGGTPDCDPTQKICSITTTPTGGEIVFGPFGGTIVGHAKNILESIPQFPFIQNTSEYDYSFDELCVMKTSGDGSVSRANDEICVNIRNKMLYGYEKLFIAKHKDRNYFEAVGRGEIESGDYRYPDFISNKDAIPAGNDFGRATLTTTIKDDIDRNGSLDDLYNAYFAAKLDVRVAKPSIATIGGGVSYVKDGSQTTGDIRKVTDGMSDFVDNSNFVGVSVGTDGISSAVDTNTDIEVIEKTEINTDIFTDDIKDVVQPTVTAGPVSSVVGFDNFSNFNGLENVYILKGKNISLAELPATVDTPTTYIVEGGNLTITKDIESNENIAFVVKGGNIIIKSDVEELSGTYISIPVDSVGGKITSESSSKQLIVYGSLLGNLNDLVSNRYYIEKSGSQLSVGTIVSFGSRLLSKPAPLVAQFKSEYNASQKVAR